MTCDRMEPERLAEWLDRVADPEVAADVSEHIAACCACADALEQMRMQSGLIRSALGGRVAPPALWPRIAAELDAEDAAQANRKPTGKKHSWRLRLLTSAALAAMLLAGVFLLQHIFARTTAPMPPAEAIAAETVQDYMTFRISQRPLDFASEDPLETLVWLGMRVNGTLPEMAEYILDYRLVGGRLCWLMKQRLGALTYARGEHHMTVYILRAPKGDAGDVASAVPKPLAWHEEGPFRSIVWAQSGYLVALVSEAAGTEMAAFAAALSRSLRLPLEHL